MPDDGSESVAVLSEEKNLDPEMKLILKQIGDFRTMQKELEDQRAENQEKYRIDTLRRLQARDTPAPGGDDDADKTDDAARIVAEKAELEKVLAEASADAGSSKRDEKDENKDKDRKRRDRSPERSRRDRDRDRDRSRRDRSGSRTRDRRRRRRSSRDRSRGRQDDRKRSKRSKKDNDASTEQTPQDSPVAAEPAAPPAPKPVGFTLTTKKKSFSLDVPVGDASFQHIDSTEAAKPSRPIIPIDYTAEVSMGKNGVPYVLSAAARRALPSFSTNLIFKHSWHRHHRTGNDGCRSSRVESSCRGCLCRR